MYCGQSWTCWADKMPITDGNGDDEDDKLDAKDEGDSMKLSKKDKDLYGFCPQTEELVLVQCEVCSMWVKPQAFKQHTVERHGPMDVKISLEEKANNKVLNSELAKTLASFSSSGKIGSVMKPPTKASLKQVPSSVRMVGNAPGERAASSVNSSSRSLKKSNTNPVVKVERIPKEVATLKKVTTATALSENSALRSVMTNLSATLSTNSVLGITNRSSIVTTTEGGDKLTNGIILKKAILTSQPSLSADPCTTASPVTSVALQPPALTTTTTSVTYTRPAHTSNPSAVSTTTFALLSNKSSSKSLPRTAVLNSALAATLAAVNAPSRPVPRPAGSSKSKKAPKERKFLPCKDREFDANKHCGVLIEDSGKPCTRSLTCKTHALGLRRTVQGRKKPFDDLLKEHKAAKEAQLKAKAEEQAAAAGAVSMVPHTTPTLVTAVTSPAAMAAVSAIKLGNPDVLMQRDIKPAIFSQSPLQRSLKPGVRPLNAVFQKITSSGPFSTSLTIKQEPSSIPSPTSLSLPSERDNETSVQEKPGVTYLSHHPKPLAVCTFGARLAGSIGLFSRRCDLVRAAVLSITEKPSTSGQPPHKKLCVEAKLPKEQMTGNSKDPYEFNMVDSGLAHQRQTVSFTIGGPVNATTGLLGKPLIKNKPRSLSTHTLTGVSVPNLAVSSSSPNIIPTLAAALLSKPTNSGAAVPRATLQTLSAQSLKRKRSSSSQGSSISGQTVVSNAIQLQGTSMGLTVSAAPAGLVGHSSQSGSGVTTASSGSSHTASAPLTAITIPGVNLTNAAIGLSATLPTNKQQGGQGQKTGNLNLKDFNFVLTGLDTSGLVNGQYLNISGTQLAELAAAQAMTATAEDKNIKRSRLANAKHSTLRTLQQGCLTAVPPNAVLVDSSALQGAVLTPVSSLAGGAGTSGGSSTFMALTSGTITSAQSGSITVAPNTIFRTVNVSSVNPQQVTLTSASFPNGIIPSSGDKVHMATGSNQQTHRITNSVQGRAGSAQTAKTLQASGLIQTQGTPICPSPGLTQLAHFKPGTYNITKGGKITMQPVSLTIPLVGNVGISTLTQQQNPHPHSQPTLLVTTSAADDGRAGVPASAGGRTEIHLQPQISTASSGVLS